MEVGEWKVWNPQSCNHAEAFYPKVVGRVLDLSPWQAFTPYIESLVELIPEAVWQDLWGYTQKWREVVWVLVELIRKEAAFPHESCCSCEQAR